MRREFSWRDYDNFEEWLHEVLGTMVEDLENKDKEIERLNNKVEELMELYTTEREVKEDYKSIINEIREKIENTTINCEGQAEDLIDDILDIIEGSDKE